MECATCSFRFFDARLTPAETDRLYCGYRGAAYFRCRHRHEFWYTEKFNKGLGNDPRTIGAKQQLLLAMLERHLDPATIVSVLDFGGDRGQFIPESLGREKYVYELSSATPVQSVTRIDTDDLWNRRFDLVMLCGVLEHCSDPQEMLRAIRKLGGEGELLLYVELPHERFNLRWARFNWFYEKYLAALLCFGPIFRMVDFYSTAVRVRWSCVPPLGFVKCHEHLNYFTEKSLEIVLKESGFDILECTLSRAPTYLGAGKVLQALARLRCTGSDVRGDCHHRTGLQPA